MKEKKGKKRRMKEKKGKRRNERRRRVHFYELEERVEKKVFRGEEEKLERRCGGRV